MIYQFHYLITILPNRIVGLLGYKIEYGKNVKASTAINLGYIRGARKSITYAYGGDMKTEIEFLIMTYFFCTK
jgi:hypothetical protein